MTYERFEFETVVKRFEPGEWVVYDGRVWEVEEWVGPSGSGEDAIVVLRGRKFGVGAAGCEPVEVSDGQA